MSSRSSAGPRRRVAVVGGGISGIAAAWTLRADADVTIFEASDRLGGHAHPVEVDDGGRGAWVDTAFLIYNGRHYPAFSNLLAELGVVAETRSASMSASFWDEARASWFSITGRPSDLFCQRRNLARPAFYKLFVDFMRFRRRAYRDHATLAARLDLPFAEYTAAISSDLFERLVAPLCFAIWSVPPSELRRTPARFLVQFFHNHGLLSGDSGSAWRSFPTSSRAYLEAFQRGFEGCVRLATPVSRIRRVESAVGDGVDVVTPSGVEHFDDVILATHADVTRKILDAPTAVEARALAAWRYAGREVVLHTDHAMLHDDRRMWTSWNVRQHGDDASVTYWLNRVQCVDARRDFFITLGDETGPRSDRAIARFDYRHPVFTREAIALRDALAPRANTGPVWFAGSYLGFGFHEDGVVSGQAAARGVLARRLASVAKSA